MLAFAGCAAVALRRGGVLAGLGAARPSTRIAAAAGAARMMCAPPGGGDTVMSTVETKLSAALSPKSLTVTPAYGDPNGSHVSIRVVSDAFAGLGTVARHRLVYKSIWEELQGPIHAVDELVTKTPEEVE